MDQLIPTTRSFFVSEKDNEVRIIFDSVETIDKGIHDILFEGNKHPDTLTPYSLGDNILYKKNIEVITDEKYKSDIRQQIKELVGMRVALTQQSKPGLAQDYMKKAGQILYDAKYGGDFDSYQDNQSTAIELTNAWKDYGRGEFQQKLLKDITLQGENRYELVLDTQDSDTDKIIIELEKKLKTYLTDVPYVNEKFDNEYKKHIIKYGRILHSPKIYEIGSEEQTYDLGDGESGMDLNKFLYSEIEYGKTSLESILKDIYPLFSHDKNIYICISRDYRLNITFEAPPGIAENELLAVKKTSDGFSIPNAHNHVVEYTCKSFPKKSIFELLPEPNILDMYPFILSEFGTEDYVKDNNLNEQRNYFIDHTNVIINTYGAVTNENAINLSIVNPDPDKNTLSEIINSRYNLTNPQELIKEDISITKGFGISEDNNNFIGINLFLEPKIFTIKNIINYFFKDENKANFDEIVKFLIRGEEMYRTRGGYECQNWHSNEVHYEGIWNIFKDPLIFPKGGKIWGEMSMDERKLIQDGLLVAKKVAKKVFSKGSADNSETLNNIEDSDMASIKARNEERADLIMEDKVEEAREKDTTSNIKWFSHNKCRNPGNRKAAPWCYTKNPNKRWDYCTEPDYSGKIARVVLLIVFFFCILLAFLMVKVLFRHQYFTAFVARLTGGQVGAEGAGK